MPSWDCEVYKSAAEMVLGSVGWSREGMDARPRVQSRPQYRFRFAPRFLQLVCFRAARAGMDAAAMTCGAPSSSAALRPSAASDAPAAAVSSSWIAHVAVCAASSLRSRFIFLGESCAHLLSFAAICAATLMALFAR